MTDDRLANPLASRPASPMARLMAAVDAVSRALEEEAAAMTAGQPEPLMEAVGAKSRALKQLESLTRESWVRDLLAGNAETSGSDDLQRLLANLQRCERQNLATGSAIVTARRDNELLLRALGYEPQSGAYTARGHTPTNRPHARWAKPEGGAGAPAGQSVRPSRACIATMSSASA